MVKNINQEMFHFEHDDLEPFEDEILKEMNDGVRLNARTVRTYIANIPVEQRIPYRIDYVLSYEAIPTFIGENVPIMSDLMQFWGMMLSHTEYWVRKRHMNL